MQAIDKLKSEGKAHEAGKLAFVTGRDRAYGCHFGMRSTRDRDATDFLRGWDEAQAEAREPAPRIKLEGRIGGFQD